MITGRTTTAAARTILALLDAEGTDLPTGALQDLESAVDTADRCRTTPPRPAASPTPSSPHSPQAATR